MALIDTQEFVFNIKDTKSKENLLKSCEDLHQALSGQNEDKTGCDLKSINVCNEIQIVCSLYLKSDNCSLE